MIQPTDRERINSLQRERYKVVKEDRRAKMRERYRARKARAVQHFGDRCADCGITYPHYVYEFHHLDPSTKDVQPSELFKRSEDNMWKELEKCVMVCSNCHLVRHHDSSY